jgi:hypothetical protein
MKIKKDYVHSKYYMIKTNNMQKQQEETGLNDTKMLCMTNTKLHISSNHAVRMKEYCYNPKHALADSKNSYRFSHLGLCWSNGLAPGLD